MSIPSASDGAVQVSDSNIYATPSSELDTGAEVTNKDQALFYTVSPMKMAILCFVSLNLYSLFWFFWNWRLQKRNGNVDCIPFLRAIFSVFFTHSLFATISETASIKQIPNSSSKAMLLATLYVALVIASNVISRIDPSLENATWFYAVYLGVTLAHIYPLYSMQLLVNQINDDPKGLDNNSMTWINWIFILLGGVVWAGLLLVAIDSFAPIL